MLTDRVVCAAIRKKDTDLVVCGARHYDLVMHKVLEALAEKHKAAEWEQGFLSNKGLFLGRMEARTMAVDNNQSFRQWPNDDELYSEDLY